MPLGRVLMGAVFVRILGVVGAALLSVVMLGSGVASATDPLTGKTFDAASAVISERMHGIAVVATVTGSQLDKSDCIVTSWHRSSFRDPRGRNTRANEYQLALNCNKDVATPGHPGNSVMSPEGAKGKKDQELAATIDRNPAWCETAEPRLEYCRKVCERTGLCEI